MRHRTFILLAFSILLATGSFSQHRSFSFAWLSDTHVGGNTGAEDLTLTVRDLNSIDSLDFVVLSGDITEMGWLSEFEETHRILSDLRIPYYIVPGNHDMKWSESAGQEFVRIFGSDRFVFNHKGFLFVGMHQGPVLRMGDGHFPPEDIRWLDSLVQTIDEDQKLIYITHYPLTPSIDNWYEASNRLRTLNTQAVLVGHGHRDRVLDFEGLPGVMGRSNLRARAERGGFTIVSVSADSIRFYERTTSLDLKPQRHALPIGVQRFPAIMESPSRHPALDLFSSGESYWNIVTGWTMTSSPAVSGSYVYVADRSGIVRSLRITDGSEVWQTPLPGPVLGNIDVREGLLAATTTSGMVMCLDATDGSVRWSVRTGHANVASPSIRDGVIYTGTSNGSFLALSAEDGSVIWRYDGVTGFVESRPLITKDKVVFGAWNSYLYCLDRDDGSLLWKWNNGSEARLLSPAAVWPVASDDRLFIVAPDRVASMLDLVQGGVIWRSGAHQVRESAGMSEDGRRFYAKTMNDSLIAYDAQSENETVLWATHCGFGYDIANSMPQERGGTVFFGTKNGLVYALDGVSGEVQWIIKHGNTIINTVAPIDADRVIVTNLDGEVALLGPAR